MYPKHLTWPPACIVPLTQDGPSTHRSSWELASSHQVRQRAEETDAETSVMEAERFFCLFMSDLSSLAFLTPFLLPAREALLSPISWRSEAQRSCQLLEVSQQVSSGEGPGGGPHALHHTPCPRMLTSSPSRRKYQFLLGKCPFASIVGERQTSTSSASVSVCQRIRRNRRARSNTCPLNSAGPVGKAVAVSGLT